MGSVENGRVLFMRLCAVCHNTGKDERHRIGPTLFGIFGRKSGTASGFNYSEQMKRKDVVWDENTLDQFLLLPRQFVPGTSMMFNGIKKAQDRRDVIAFLATLK
ncbi:unnamed protein product [Xylocopa violacea]|uniref:Cytochrome c domain-containing protein n=1 Tax=Xylocopa violacea TaxID=135666 RepID=A0ABP1N512_XYLVO